MRLIISNNSDLNVCPRCIHGSLSKKTKTNLRSKEKCVYKYIYFLLLLSLANQVMIQPLGATTIEYSRLENVAVVTPLPSTIIAGGVPLV